MRLWLFLACLSVGFCVSAQDLNGIWKGKLVQEPGGCFTEYNIELQMNFIATANTMSGRVYDYLDMSRYVKLDFSGRYNTATKRMVLIENSLLESKVPVTCTPCIKTWDLTWKKEGSEEVLTGECRGRQFGSQDACPAYKVQLRRSVKSDFSVDVEQSPELAALQKTLVLKPRDKELVQEVSLDSPKIKLDLYDNAEIDNDTVTVLLNNKLLLYRQMLTDRPLTIYLNAFPNTDYELVMYADNLGSIPPNT
ncbi:MAG: hypothetical protein JST39_07675, partial [Bacteroidetes bacterium]|nr:hypothetical protein [Bacteroidota bacterium]